MAGTSLGAAHLEMYRHASSHPLRAYVWSGEWSEMGKGGPHNRTNEWMNERMISATNNIKQSKTEYMKLI